MSASRPTQVSYGYDAEGQMTRAGNTDLTFDYDHRLATIGSTTQFHYDGRGNRLSVTRAGAETLYVYDPWGNLLATWDGTAGFRKYVYGRGLIALQVGAARYCYHFNGVGSTVALTDMTGSVVNSYAYDPFGVILARNEQVVQPFQFVGQYGVMAEPEGLYYMRARYYDPNVGRFISEDPLGFAGGDVNLYAYVQNNPLTRIDPLGLTQRDIDVAIALARSTQTDLTFPSDDQYHVVPASELGISPATGKAPSAYTDPTGTYCHR